MINVEKNFNKEVLDNKGITVVDFWANWCGPCKMFAPIYEKVKSNHQDIKFCKLNIDADDEKISDNLGVMSIPTIVAFKNGKEIKRFSGFMTEDSLNEFLEEL